MLGNLLKLGKDSFWNIVLVSATLIGAFGGFPEPPKVFINLTKYTIVQWLLVFILAYQGGAGQDISFAVGATVFTFLVYHFVRYFEGSEDDLLL